tara:strand:- start:1554 stop:2291 length:738 start_codon:yes stop_codon:yes gene_type:complete
MSLLIFFFIISVVPGQTIIIRDAQTSKPLENVNVYSNQKGATTDNNGICNLNIFEKNDRITFSLIGYRVITLPYSEVTKIVYLENESIPMELVRVIGKNNKSRKRYIRLEKNVRKVYPYAKKISNLLIEYDNIIDSLDQYSGLIRYQKKRKIFSKIEKELISKYGLSMRKLTKSQGRILIRLVDRETSRTSYTIIKDFRNILSAGFWQLAARLFGHNLRSEYNSEKGEDRMIEFIINRIDNEKNK